MTARLAKGMAWHGYVGAERHLEVFRNPRRFQHRGSRFILFRTSNHSSDGFASWEDAKAYGSRLNPKIEWRLERALP